MLKGTDLIFRTLKFALALFLVGSASPFVAAAAATTVVVELRNGDRITAELLTQETNHIVIKSGWAGTISLPLSVVGGLRTSTGADLLAVAKPPPAPAKPAAAPAKPAPATAAKPAPAPAPAPKKKTYQLKHTVQIGSNLAFGERDSQAIWARIRSVFEKPYQGDAKKFLRATAEYTTDYGETENVVSANRMSGSLKTDFDLGTKTYIYNLGSLGYDDVRYIDFQYAVGPGMGYHLFKRPKFDIDLEGGLNYQMEHRSVGSSPDTFYVRAANTSTWRLTQKITLSKKLEFFMNGEDYEQFRFRLDANASYKLLDNVSLNLTVMDQYDTDPPPHLNQNELQFRSSIGITF